LSRHFIGGAFDGIRFPRFGGRFKIAFFGAFGRSGPNVGGGDVRPRFDGNFRTARAGGDVTRPRPDADGWKRRAWN
jgi:hypothetical protein